jgi:ABC-type multidrug transport system fused ATPase/permease subunit
MVLDKGNVIEIGSHAYLMQQGTHYKKLQDAGKMQRIGK